MKRKSFTCFVLIALLFSTIGIPQVSAKLTDVPTDHWAYHAVATLVNKGYLAVYEDGTFQGTRAVDRYTLAVTLARILDEIEAGRVQGSVDDLSLIRELSSEFREELVVWYADRDALDSKLTAIQKSSVATEDRVNRVVSAQVELQEEVEKIKADLLSEIQRRDNLAAEQQVEQQFAIEQQAQQISNYAAQIDEHKARLDELLTAIVQLEDELLKQKTAVGGLENWAGEKSAVFAALQNTDEQLQEETMTLRLRLDELGELSAADVAALQAAYDELLGSLEVSLAQVTQLNERNLEMEKDMQNLAVLLQRETQRREDLSAQIETAQHNLQQLEEQIGLSEEQLSELSNRVSSDVSVQMNAALIREQRLERQIKELQEEFASYKETAESKQKSSKTLASIALAVAAIGVVIGFLAGN